MTAPTRPRRRTAPSQDVIDKAARIVTNTDRPILTDYHAPDVPAVSMLVPSGTDPHASYGVAYGRLLGWRCTCRATTVCAHLLAAWVVLDGSDDAEVWAGLREAWMTRTDEEDLDV